MGKDNKACNLRLIDGADTVTYVKTSVPQPAVRVKSRGPRSRAGFMAAPQLADIDTEIPRTTVATTGGSNPLGAGAFL